MMTEAHSEMQEDYEALCALLGPLDYFMFCDGYLSYARWKNWTPAAVPTMTS